MSVLIIMAGVVAHVMTHAVHFTVVLNIGYELDSNGKTCKDRLWHFIYLHSLITFLNLLLQILMSVLRLMVDVTTHVITQMVPSNVVVTKVLN